MMERVKMLFPGHRRLRSLEHRIDALQAELLAALERETASVARSVELVRDEGHAERDSAFLRQVDAIEKQAGNVAKCIEMGNASLAEQIELMREEGHAERDSAFLRQADALKEQTAAITDTISQGNASLAGQIERVRVEGHAERDSALERQMDALKEQTADIADTISQGNASLAGQVERVRVEGHAERDSALERQMDALKAQAANISESISRGNASLAEQIERVRVEGHDERTDGYRRVVTELFRNDIRCRWQIVDAMDPLIFPPDTIAACPICGHADTRLNYEKRIAECRFGGGRLERYVCPECGAIFGPLKMMRLSPEQMGEEYQQSYAVYSESDCTLLEKMAFESLHPSKKGVYLNYGAGAWNRTTKDLRADGYDVYDYEPYAPAETNPWVIRSFADLEKMKFDGIFSNDLIEHLQNPVADLKAMAGLLKDGAEMAHCSGCYEYAFEYTRFHLFFLTGKSLKRLSAEAGLTSRLGDRLFDYSPARICKFGKKKVKAEMAL